MKNRHSLFLLLFLCCSLQLSAQTRSVQGVVKSASNEETLIGATVQIKGTTTGTTTDVDGNFTIDVEEDKAVLMISYTGFRTMEQQVGKQSYMEINLEENIAELEEVVVIGYGVQKKSVTTGAISKVDAEDLEDMPVARLEQSLQGRTSGVIVTSNSGQPGTAATVRIRGTTTINNSDPLYVVDGIPINGGIEFLNQSDIESIQVLKDAASASIYGTRAASGVILVTTNSGKSGRTSVNYNAYYGVQSPWKKLSLLNAQEYGVLMNESAAAAGAALPFDDPAALGEGTDWQDAVFGENLPIQNHELSISAGTEKSKYYASFGYFDQEGIVGGEKSRFQRFSVRFNSNHNIGERVKFGNVLGYSRIKSRGIAENSEFGGTLSRVVNLDPVTPVYETDPDRLNSSVFTNFPVVSDENGVFGISELVTSEVLNPLAALEVLNGNDHSDKIVGRVFGEVEIIEGLTFRSSVGVDLAFWGNESFAPVHYLNATNRLDINRYARTSNRGLYWIFENTLNFKRTFGLHEIDILAGTVAENNSGEGIGGSIQNLPVDNLGDASLAFPTPIESQTYFGFEYENTLSSLLGRINYNFNQKYLASFVLRRDGSSKFGSNRRYGTFPSASLGWVASEEDFLVNNSSINFLKVRASWGVNGNNQINDFLFFSTVGGFRNYTFGQNDELVNGVSPNAIANPDLRWERTTQLNIGFDARLFRNFSLTVDVFKKDTDDMLLDIQVPGFVGNQGPVGNVGKMENRGFELELGYDNLFGKFEIGLSGNIAYLENEVLFLNDSKTFLPGQRFSPQGLEITRITVGQPIGHFFGYKTDGLFQNQAEVDAHTNTDGEPLQPEAAPGDIRFVDFNQDGILDEEDRTFIGDPTPDWIYGFNLTAAWKGFDILLFGQGVAGNDVFKATRRFDLQMANLTSDALGRWTGEGTSTNYPRLVNNDPNRNFSRSSDFYVENGAYFRIRTLQLGYTLPRALCEKISIRKARFYVSGNNLLTFTQYSGFDPEIGGGSFGVDRGIYPQPRFYLLGINVTY
ncbi:MAG: TonB-dependent receptor [Bacteroidota bacterium]